METNQKEDIKKEQFKEKRQKEDSKKSKQEEIVLTVKDISKTYQAKNGEIEALTDINFDIRQGEFISIIGPSGCGKSTLLSIISGL